MKKSLFIQIKNEILDEAVLLENKIRARIKYYNIKTDKDLQITFYEFNGKNIINNETTILLQWWSK